MFWDSIQSQVFSRYLVRICYFQDLENRELKSNIDSVNWPLQNVVSTAFEVLLSIVRLNKDNESGAFQFAFEVIAS